jgi:hypothetical protein
MLAVYVAAFRLFVWTVCATFAHTLVDADSEPCERLVDIVLGSGHEAAAVGVFYTENHVAPVLAGENIIVKRGAYTADVERSRRRRRESYSNLAFHVLVLFGRVIIFLQNYNKNINNSITGLLTAYFFG